MTRDSRRYLSRCQARYFLIENHVSNSNTQKPKAYHPGAGGTHGIGAGMAMSWRFWRLVGSGVIFLLINLHRPVKVRYDVQKYGGANMQRLRIDQDIRSMSEFRAGIASFIKQVHDTKRPLVITQHGKGAAVLLDVGEYEDMQEKLELLKDIQISVNQIEDGEGLLHDNAKETILKRIK